MSSPATLIKRGATLGFTLESLTRPNSNFVPRRAHQELSAPLEEQLARYEKARRQWKHAEKEMRRLERRWHFWITPAAGYDYEPSSFKDFVPHTVTVFDETVEEYEARTTPDQRWGYPPPINPHFTITNEGVAA